MHVLNYIITNFGMNNHDCDGGKEGIFYSIYMQTD